MRHSLVYPRWIPLFLGFIINAAVGMTTYSWSLFIAPLQAEFGWSRMEIALAFALCCLMFGLLSFPAGKLSDKFGPAPVVVVGGILLGVGFFLTGYAQTRLHLYLTYGVLAGAGSGLIYLPPVALAPRWWPDRKALPVGIIVLGLGLGSFLMAPLASYIMQDPDLGWRYVFRYCGIAMGVMSVLAGLALRVPPAGWKPEGWVAPVQKSSEKKVRDYTHKEAVDSPQFFLLYLAYFCCAFAGLLIIGHIAGYAQDRGMTPWQATWAVSIFAVANAATRICSGILLEFIVIRKYFLALASLQVACMLAMMPAGGSVTLLWVLAALIGWNYGAIFTLFPAYCLQYFGPTAQGSNYGLLFSAWGVAGFLGPLAGGWLKDTSGSYGLPFIFAAVVAVVGVAAISACKAPAPKAAS